MEENILAEITLFAGNFAPRNWAFCNGQILAISQNTALFSLLGATYGGDGKTTFALPDLRGRVAVGAGQGPGLSQYDEGQTGGAETTILTPANMPQHHHTISGTVNMKATAAAGDSDAPQNNYPAVLSGTDMYSSTQNGNTMADMQYNLSTGSTGASSSFSIIQPVLGLSFIICLAGIFPARN
jgi:microcystin-dependent protein